MKVLRTEFRNIKLYKENLVIDFVATDRVVNKEEVYKESTTLNRQKVISIAGINATGKTLSLRLMKFAFNLLKDNTVLKDEKVEYSLFQENSEIIIDILINDEIFRLKSIIGVNQDSAELFMQNKAFYYKNEFIFKKLISEVKKKTDVFMWDDSQIIFERNTLKIDEQSMLNNNHSMIIKITNQHYLRFIPFIDNTNLNALVKGMNYDKVYFNLFDDSLETVEFKEKDNIKIKFKKKMHNYKVMDVSEQFRLLSSGTIKGTVLLNLITTLFESEGVGYFIVDELEAHLNKTLVEFLIELFMDDKINKFGSVLVFTTHYLEILDSINRKDAIYVSTKDENYNLKLVKFASVINRNDVKKSDILLSNYFGNTAPSYEQMQNIKRALCKRKN
ncbi:MAG: AAA family ATPase [Pleomorphochaeta sp.]